MEKKIIVITGKKGSGKSTVAHHMSLLFGDIVWSKYSKTVENYLYENFSTPDLLVIDNVISKKVLERLILKLSEHRDKKIKEKDTSIIICAEYTGSLDASVISLITRIEVEKTSVDKNSVLNFIKHLSL